MAKDVDGILSTVYKESGDATKVVLADIAQEKALELVTKGFDKASDQVDCSKGIWNCLFRKFIKAWLKAAKGCVKEKVNSLSKILSETLEKPNNSERIRQQVHGRVGKQLIKLLKPRIRTKATAGLPDFLYEQMQQ